MERPVNASAFLTMTERLANEQYARMTAAWLVYALPNNNSHRKPPESMQLLGTPLNTLDAYAILVEEVPTAPLSSAHLDLMSLKALEMRRDVTVLEEVFAITKPANVAALLDTMELNANIRPYWVK